MPRDGGRMANMLMVTATMRMLNRVHAHALHLGPVGTLSLAHVRSAERGRADLGRVVGSAGLENRLLNATAASNNTNHCASKRGHALLLAARQLQLRRRLRVAHNRAELARGASERAAVTS